MAEKIKGIIVTIGGDTTGLDKALKDTNKGIADTQSELKKVERLLKLDPTNTILLEQKQQLLTKSIADTSGKLDTLKEAEKQVQAQFKDGKVSEEQYRALQREVVATEQGLKVLEQQAADSVNKIGDLGTAAGQSLEGLKNQVDASADKLDLLGTKAEKMNNFMKNATIGVLGLGAGLVGIAVKAGKSADDINTLAKQTGLSTEEIQKFQYAAEIIDVPLETLTGSMSKLTKNMATAQKGSGDAATAFDTLGISVVDSDGYLRSNQDVFAETIDKLSKMENVTQRDAYAMQIFGKSAQDLNPLILGGADALKQLGDDAEAAGLILSQDALDGANAFNDGIDQLKAKGESAIGVIGGQIAEKLLPMMDKLIDAVSKLISWIMDNSNAIITTIASIAAGLVAFNVVVMIQGLITAFQGWKAATDGMTISQKLLNLAQAANPLGLIVTAIAAAVAAIVVLWNTNEGFRNAVIACWDAVVAKFTAVANWISTVFTEGWNAAVGFLTQTFSGFVTVITFAWDAITAKFTAVVNWISTVFAKGWNAAVGFLTQTFSGFVTAITFAWDAITAKFTQVSGWLATAFATDWSTSFGVFGEIMNGFFQNVSNTWDAITRVFNGVIDFVTGIFTGNWQQAWQGVSDIFGGVFDGLVALAKAPLNGIIAMLNGAIEAINMLIRGLNSISFDIPDWVPELGGLSFGFNIPTIGKIPYLAKGGNLFSGSAVVGEAGPELLQMVNGHAVVTPLSGGQLAKPAVQVTMNCNFGSYTPAQGAAAARDLMRTINRELGRAY